MLTQIQSSAYEKMAPGAYPGVFQGLTIKETKNGNAYLWSFKLADGKILTRFTGEPGKPATMGNRYGKWLCALAGKPISECAVDPDTYVGRQYMCIVVAEGVLETFTLMG